jgi:hypothetical protein
MARVLIAVTLMAVLAFSIAEVGAYTRDKPYYTTGDTTLKGVMKVDSNCWDLIYLRGTPKGANHVLLNYQYWHNDNPTSEIKTITLSYELKFKIVRILQSPEQRARVYAEVELTTKDYEYTATVYFGITQDMKGKTISVPTLYLHTNPSLCR